MTARRFVLVVVVVVVCAVQPTNNDPRTTRDTRERRDFFIAPLFARSRAVFQCQPRDFLFFNRKKIPAHAAPAAAIHVEGSGTAVSGVTS